MHEFEKWENAPTLEDLRKDYKSAQPSHQKQLDRIDSYLSIYNEEKTVVQRSGLKKRKSTYRSRLLRKQLEWVIPNIESPVLSTDTLFSLDPTSGTSIGNQGKNSKILNHQWRKQIGKVAIVNKSVRKFAKEGSCVLKVGWSLETKTTTAEQEVADYAESVEDVRALIAKAGSDQQMVNAIIDRYNKEGRVPIGSHIEEIDVQEVVKNNPKITVKDNRAIIIDPAAKGVWSDVKFLIDIQETDYATLMNNPSYFNMDYVKKFIMSSSDMGTSDFHNATMQDYDEDDQFVFSDLARKKVTMYEYWGYWDINNDGKLVSIVAAWIGSKLVRLEENPYPHKEIPYIVAAFNPIDDEIWGEPEAVLIEDDQKALTSTFRAMQDITKDNAVGQSFIDDSIFKTPIQRDNFEAGRDVYVNRGTDLSKAISKKSVEPVPSVLFDMKNLYTEHSTLLTGVEDMDGGAGSRIQQSASGAPIKLDAKTNREMEVLRRYLSMIEKMGSLCLSMNKEYLLSSAIVGSGKEAEEIGEVDDLSSDYDVSIDVSTPAINDAKASKIMFLMHNNGANMSPRLSSLHYAKTASLWNMTDLADEVMNEANRPPSEAEQMAQQLEMERMQLENQEMRIKLLSTIKEMEFKDARILEIEENLQAGSMDAKVFRDKAQAELALAQADKMDAQVQLFDQEFNLIEDGTKRTSEKEDHEFQHLANLEREELRTKREQENIKLKEKKKDDSTSKEDNVEYIRNGTLKNDTYDAADDIMRNILTKNSLDTSELTKDAGSIRSMPSVKDPMKSDKVNTQERI